MTLRRRRALFDCPNFKDKLPHKYIFHLQIVHIVSEFVEYSLVFNPISKETKVLGQNSFKFNDSGSQMHSF